MVFPLKNETSKFARGPNDFLACCPVYVAVQHGMNYRVNPRLFKCF
jgi:hypothetical protein